MNSRSREEFLTNEFYLRNACSLEGFLYLRVLFSEASTNKNRQASVIQQTFIKQWRLKKWRENKSLQTK